MKWTETFWALLGFALLALATQAEAIAKILAGAQIIVALHHG